jgi:diaminopimelate decarboxylase
MNKNTTQIKAAVVREKGGPFSIETLSLEGPRRDESSDVLGYARSLPPQEQGDLLAVMTAGAYGMSMASNYNSRLRPAEVLVDGSKFRVVRRRETIDDLLRNET